MDRVTTTVGARELKTRLGSYLKRVGRGQSFIVTDRRQPVAELRPLTRTGTAVDARLAAMAALGAVTLPRSSRLAPFVPIVSRGRTASEVIRLDRDERG